MHPASWFIRYGQLLILPPPLSEHKQTRCIWTKKRGRIIRHKLMELTRNSIAVLAILIGPFSGLIEWVASLLKLGSSLRPALSCTFRRALDSLSLFWSVPSSWWQWTSCGPCLIGDWGTSSEGDGYALEFPVFYLPFWMPHWRFMASPPRSQNSDEVSLA